MESQILKIPEARVLQELRQRDQGWTGGALGGERGSAQGDAVNCDHFKIYTNIQLL